MGLWYQQKDHKPSGTPPQTCHFHKRIDLKNGVSVGLTRVPFSSGTLSSLPHPADREQIIVALDGNITDTEGATPESYIADLYLAQGPRGLLRLEGAAGVILHDTRSSTTLLYRTPLTGYPLYYTHRNQLLSAATNPVHLLYRQDISDGLRNEELGHFFSLNFTALSGNIFSDIELVRQGELVIFNRQEVTRKYRSWVRPQIPGSNRPEKQLIKDYRTLLDNAVRNCITPDRQHGIMLSSGMDSSSIATLAAKHLRSTGSGLTAYSWSLPGDSRGDEIKQIEEICRFLDIPLKSFNGERHGPFDSLDNPLLLPDTPYTNPFSPLTAACYDLAGRDGVQGLFSGNYADLLFADNRSLLLEALRDGRFAIALSALSDVFRKNGFHSLQRSPAVRGLVAALLPFHSKRKRQHPAWLTENTREALAAQETDMGEAGQYRRPHHFQTLSCAFQAGYLGMDRYLSGRYGIQRLEPHRDRELVNFCFRLPAYMSYRNGQTKYFAREGMRGLLPESIRRQPRAGDLNLLVLNSLKRNMDRVQDELFSNNRLWSDHVRESWLRHKLDTVDQLSYGDIMVIWNCLNFGLWRRAICPGGTLYENA